MARSLWDMRSGTLLSYQLCYHPVIWRDERSGRFPYRVSSPLRSIVPRRVQARPSAAGSLRRPLTGCASKPAGVRSPRGNAIMVR